MNIQSISVSNRNTVAIITASVIILGAIWTAFSAQRVDAAGTMADAMCVPVFIECPCGMKPNPKKPPNCIPGPNMHQCPCFDVTNGFTTPGTCVGPFKCKASSPEGMPPMPPMIPMPMPMPSMPMPDQPCNGDGGGVFGDRSKNTATGTESSTSTQPACPSGGNDYTQSGYYPNYDSNSSSGNSSTDASVSNMVSSLLNGTLNDTNTNTVTQTTGTVGSGATTTRTTSKPFGSADGITGDIQVFGNNVTLMVSNRDSTRGTQVSGFYGFLNPSGVSAAKTFKNLCGFRPWATNFLSFIVPSSYLDNLCRLRGYPLGTPAAVGASTRTTTSGVRSAGTASTGTSVSNTVTQPKPVYLGKVRADIWAVPPSVTKGARTSVFWEAIGVSSCSITNSAGNFTGSSLSGHASTQAISVNTTFSIKCQTATSTVQNQVVVTVTP